MFPSQKKKKKSYVCNFDLDQVWVQFDTVIGTQLQTNAAISCTLKSSNI